MPDDPYAEFQSGAAAAPDPYAEFKREPPPPQPSAIERFSGSFFGALNPIPVIKAVMEASDDPAKARAMTKAIFDAPGEQFEKAHKAWNEGKHVEAAGHLLGSIPLIGPAAAAVGEQMGGTDPVYDKYGNIVTPGREPDIAGGLGAGIAQVGSVLAPGAVAKVRGIPVPRVLPKNPNLAETAAYDAFEAAGGQVPAGVRTGNQYVKGVQAFADTSPIGGFIEDAANKANTQAFRNWSENLQTQVHPTPATPEIAGQGTMGALESKASGHFTAADTNYSAFRQAESNPANVRSVQTGRAMTPEARSALDREALAQFNKGFDSLDPAQKGVVQSAVRDSGVDLTAKPVMENVAMPVDIRPIKAQLKPIYDSIMETWEPTQRNASKGLQMIKSILDKPDMVSASVAEDGLSGIKDLARNGTGRAQGMAKFATTKVQQAIDDAVGSMDPQGLRALQAGRESTALGHEIEDIGKRVAGRNEEPVAAFRRLTAPEDANIELLRKVVTETPQMRSQIGRALLTDIITPATEEGGFARGAGIANKWGTIGDSTKKLLYTPRQIQDLDNFFLASRRLAEPFNASRSGVLREIGHGVGMVAGMKLVHPATGVGYLLGTGALAKLLRSPAGVRALTQGFTIPLGNRAAAAMAAGRILELAGDSAVRLPGAASLPQAAESNAPTQQTSPLAVALTP